MKSLPRPDNKRLEAAEGWLGLGNWKEANEELENIRPEFPAGTFRPVWLKSALAELESALEETTCLAVANGTPADTIVKKNKECIEKLSKMLSPR